MCEADAYLLHEDGKEELYLAEVDVIEPCPGGQLRLISVYGEQKFLAGRIKNMSLLQHKVFLEVIS
ncbi:MAG: CooT family nickel-binding protein [Desulfarculales bacterium]|jgi:predicted RNA-binding protein|nr:CooT family nickel-binding protein [Desulfarculales bacterium]